jgi:hypothetical protein
MKNEGEDSALLEHLCSLMHKLMTSTDTIIRFSSASHGVRICCIHTNTRLNCAATPFKCMFQKLFVFGEINSVREGGISITLHFNSKVLC